MPTNHPLVYAVLELRVPFSPKLAGPEAATRLSSLMPELPVLRQEPRGGVVTQTPDGGMKIDAEVAWRFLNIESTRSLIVGQSAITYETTRYPGFEEFTRDIESCLAAIVEVAPPVGYDRLGLRYVNEVRPEREVGSYSAWRRYVAPPLVESLSSAEQAIGLGLRTSNYECRLQTAESTLLFALPDNAALTLRMANMDGPGVVGNEPLRRYHLPESSPFHVVDFDGYWPRQASDIRPFRLPEILELMAHVHSPVKAAFKWATTKSYRDEAGVADK